MIKNYSDMVGKIRQILKDYIVKQNLKSLVLGVSGGIDSALVAALAKPVCDELNIKLIGRSLPCGTNTQDEIDRAKNVGELFCHDFREIDLFSTPYSFDPEPIERIDDWMYPEPEREMCLWSRDQIIASINSWKP
jgi:NH3-dependent NAD+ synthetase